jgi:Flp pilus assembly protein TadD
MMTCSADGRTSRLFVPLALFLLVLIMSGGCTHHQASGEKRVEERAIRPVPRQEPTKQKMESNRLGLARELVARRLYAVALAQLAEADATTPHVPEIDYLKGQCYLGLSDFGKAIDSFKQALAKDGRHAQSYGGLGLAYDLSGARELAWKAYEKAIDIDPALVEPYNNLGFSKLAAGRYREGEHHFLAGLAVNRDSSITRNNLALSYALQGRNEEAMALLEQSGGRASALANMGVLCELSGDRESAARYYRSALSEDDGPAEARENLRALEAASPTKRRQQNP